MNSNQQCKECYDPILPPTQATYQSRVLERYQSPGYVQSQVQSQAPEQYGSSIIYNQPKMTLQPYTSTSTLGSSIETNRFGDKFAKVTFTTGEPLPFCNDAVSIDPPDPFAVSLNQSLAGSVRGDSNPVTKIKPVVVPPAYDLESWRDNNLVTYSNINSPGIQQEMYLSGYAESTCCGYIGNGTELVPRPQEKIPTLVGGKLPQVMVEEYVSPVQGSSVNRNQSRLLPGAIVSPVPVDNTAFVPQVQVMNPGNFSSNRIQENYCGSSNRMSMSGSLLPGAIVSPTPVDNRAFVPRTPVVNPGNFSNPNRIQENYCGNKSQRYLPGAIVAPVPVDNTPYLPTIPVNEPYCLETDDTAVPLNVQPNRSGWVNTACGYNPDQVQVGLPSNLPVGNCDQDPAMRQYNENLFTQIITPGVYTVNQVNEPINSNIGISFTQQFEPVTAKRDDKGLKFTLHDPRIIEPAFEMPSEAVKAQYDNVYDPRFYGYGTSYRSYLEPVTGQTRFMYEDVNAIRMPNYVTRSKIDHLPYADHYGPMEAGSELGNVLNPNIRYLAQDSWFRDSMTFREDMQQRLMRKVNAEAWQKRLYPNSSRPVGSSHVMRTS